MAYRAGLISGFALTLEEAKRALDVKDIAGVRLWVSEIQQHIELEDDDSDSGSSDDSEDFSYLEEKYDDYVKTGEVEEGKDSDETEEEEEEEDSEIGAIMPEWDDEEALAATDVELWFPRKDIEQVKDTDTIIIGFIMLGTNRIADVFRDENARALYHGGPALDWLKENYPQLGKPSLHLYCHATTISE